MCNIERMLCIESFDGNVLVLKTPRYKVHRKGTRTCLIVMQVVRTECSSFQNVIIGFDMGLGFLWFTKFRFYCQDGWYLPQKFFLFRSRVYFNPDVACNRKILCNNIRYIFQFWCSFLFCIHNTIFHTHSRLNEITLK